MVFLSVVVSMSRFISFSQSLYLSGMVQLGIVSLDRAIAVHAHTQTLKISFFLVTCILFDPKRLFTASSIYFTRF